jgi:hypothetical protein
MSSALTVRPADRTHLACTVVCWLPTCRLLPCAACLQELTLRQVTAVLQPAIEQLQLAGLAVSLQQQFVQLDALVFLVCLMAAGSVDDKLQLCFNALVARWAQYEPVHPAVAEAYQPCAQTQLGRRLYGRPTTCFLRCMRHISMTHAAVVDIVDLHHHKFCVTS